jgi:hypothetical protein
LPEAQQRRERGAALLCKRNPPRSIAVDQSLHYHGCDRRAGDAALLPFRAAGNTEKQHPFGHGESAAAVSLRPTIILYAPIAPATSAMMKHLKIYGASPESAIGRYGPAESTGAVKTRIEGKVGELLPSPRVSRPLIPHLNEILHLQTPIIFGLSLRRE